PVQLQVERQGNISLCLFLHVVNLFPRLGTIRLPTTLNRHVHLAHKSRSYPHNTTARHAFRPRRESRDDERQCPTVTSIVVEASHWYESLGFKRRNHEEALFDSSIHTDVRSWAGGRCSGPGGRHNCCTGAI